MKANLSKELAWSPKPQGLRPGLGPEQANVRPEGVCEREVAAWDLPENAGFPFFSLTDQTIQHAAKVRREAVFGIVVKLPMLRCGRHVVVLPVV